MKMHKILALIYSDWLILKSNKGRIADVVYLPITTIIIYGMFVEFIKDKSLEAGLIVLIINILWQFAFLAQNHINMLINEDSWSGSFKQIMASGISGFEYLIARIFSSIMVSVIFIFITLIMSIYLFDIPIILTEWKIFSLIIIATLISSIALSVFVAGCIIALGREYSFLAWSMMQLFVMFSAPFFPVSIYPAFMQPIVMVMPFTNAFESARLLMSGIGNFSVAINGLYISLLYLIISIPFYKYIFEKARKKGWLTRLG